MGQERKIMENDKIKEELQTLKLQDLPHLILFHIVGYLDMSSKVNAWKACTQLRRVLRRRVFVKSVDFTKRRVPRATCDYLHDNAMHIEELNLSCAKGLSEEEAVAVLKCLKNLRSLDVTYTAVTLRGASYICSSCPRLVRLACNVIDSEAQCLLASTGAVRDSFMKLESVNFVCSPRTPLEVLDVLVHARKLKEFEWTECQPLVNSTLICKRFKRSVREHPFFQSFSCHVSLEKLPRNFKFISRKYDTTWQFFAVAYAPDTDTRIVFLSPGLHAAGANCRYPSELFREVSLEETVVWNWMCTIDLYAWRSTAADIDSNVYIEVLREIESNLSKKVCKNIISERLKHKISLPKYKSYRICHSTFKENNVKSNEKNYDINLCASVPADQTLKITLDSCCLTYLTCNTILSANCVILRKILHLSLREDTLDSCLYETLFQSCVNLETLDIEIEMKDLETLSKTLHLSRSLRNISIGVHKHVNHNNTNNILFSLIPALISCPNLENVCIIGLIECTDIEGIEDIVELFLLGCPNLCSLRICCDFSENFQIKCKDVIRKISKKLKMDDLYVSFNLPDCFSSKASPEYPPSLVFFEAENLSRLKVNRKRLIEDSANVNSAV